MAGRRTWPRNLPWVYSNEHFREVANWANSELGRLMRAWWPAAFPGAPWESVIGFASNGNPNEVVQIASMSEFGWAGLTGGPRGEEPPTRSRAAENQYLTVHNWPFVRFCLGRDACMTPGCWRPSNGGLPDQTAAGIASLIAHGDGVRSAMLAGPHPAVAPRARPPWAGGTVPSGPSAPMSMWNVATSFWGWSSGDGRAASHMAQPGLAEVTEGERFWRLGSQLADAAYRAPLGGDPDSHSSIAHAWTRCVQKFWMAMVIAEWSKDAAWNIVDVPGGAPVRIGGAPRWFLQGAPENSEEVVWIASVLAARASGHDPASVGIGPRPGSAGAGWGLAEGFAAAAAAAAFVGIAATIASRSS